MKPQSETELAELIREANGPLRVHGGGTRPVGRPAAATPLDISGLSGITLYEPGALTLVVAAGTSLAEVEAALAAEGQRLAFEPADWRGLLGTSGEPTIGGMVAANISGPRRIQAGACRDALLGVRFVDGTGAVVKNGGRVMKNVTGYDLVKLMAGSWGTLGVLTEVALKVLPAPEATATLILNIHPVKDVVAALSAALGSPFDVTGAAYLPDTGVLVRIEGFSGSVTYRAGRLAETLGRFGPVEIDHEPAHNFELWRRVATAAPFHNEPGNVWRISVKPSDAPGIVARLGCPVMLDWGGGLIWALAAQGRDVRSEIGPFEGHATLVRADGATRAKLSVFHPEPAPIAAISAGLRERFDPKGIFNPGIMG
ncbi:MAG: FAD-binding protein [Paracoccaceae bacterium]|nr:FAD-binding protein [Paracoccaceae bacterium]MDH5531840.1 FAD-binding protein [Paracoccaceae bacterium]